MTVTTTTSVTVAQGNGVTTIFPYNFYVVDEDHLIVQRRVRATSVVDLTYSVNDYSVSGIGDDAGEVTFTTAPASTYDIIISRVVPYTQELDIVNQGGFYPATVEAQLDAMVMQTQQIAADVGRTLKASIGETLSELPAADVRAGQFLVFDAEGDATVTGGTGADGALRTDLAADAGTSLISVGDQSLQAYLRRVTLTPEQFDATGAGGDDQNTEMLAMMVAARTAGRAVITLTEGSTYTVTNPFMVGGLRELEIRGNNATWMNARSGAFPGAGVAALDANWQPWRSPVIFLPNGVELANYSDASQGSGVLDWGATVATVEAGSTALSVTAGTLYEGKAIIYAWDRYQEDGFPPAASYFESIFITDVTGANVTLAFPLEHRYDATAPEKANRAGAVRVLMLNRTVGTYREHIAMDRLAIYDLHFVENPLITGTVVNGLPSYGGAKFIYVEGGSAPKATITACGTAHFKGFRCFGDFEIDKMIDTVIIDAGCEIGTLVGGLGCKQIIVRKGARILGNINLAPTVLLHIEDEASLVAINEPGDRYLIGTYAYGSANIVVDSARITVANTTADRVFECNDYDLTPTITSTTQFTAARAAFDTSGWLKVLRIGTIVYAGNVPVAEITRMPWVPAGSLFTADVAIGYKLLGGAIAPATVLTIPALANVRVGKLTLEGPYARQVQSLLGADIVAVGQKLACIRTSSVRETEIEIEFHKLVEFYGTGIVMKSLGRAFRVGSMEIDVTRVAVDAGAVGMFIGGDEADGTNIGIITSIDLKTLGRRTLTGTTLSVLGADVLGGAGYGIPAELIVDVRVTDNSRALAEGNRAAGKIILKGYWA